MSKIRIYELARELGTDNRRLEKFVRGLGIEIKNYMSTVSEDEAARVRRQFKGDGVSVSTTNPSPKRRSPQVIRRRATGPKPSEKERLDQPQPGSDTSTVEPPVPASARPGRSDAAASSGGAPQRRVRSSEAARVSSQAAREPQVSQRQVVQASRESESDVLRPSQESRPASGSLSGSSGGSSGSPSPSNGRSATVSRSEQGPSMSQEPQVPAGAGADSVRTRKADEIQVGQRITLPKGSHRFRGGLADRLEKESVEPRPAAAGVAKSGGQRRVVSADPSATAPEPARNTPAVAAPKQSSPPPSRVVEAAKDSAPEPVSPPVAEQRRSAKAEEEASGDDATSRVVRDSDGVIVAAASKQSSPKILGFINIEPRRRQQQVIITEASQPSKTGRASARKRREEKVQQQGRRRPANPRARRDAKRSGRGVNTQEMSEAKKRLRVNEAILVADLAHQMGVKSSRIIRTLWTMGMRGITINNAVDVETAEMVAAEFGYTVENVSFDEGDVVTSETSAEGPTELRAPVVAVMGHVDHGKTTLLDFIRSANVVSGEAGGITQHVGAYRVESEAGPIVFLDTPGHEAFTMMRSRGAAVTDILVLVVAADDGVMPTTQEAIKHAKKAGIPIVVAINKIDKPEANPGRVKQMLMAEGVVGEEFGGDTPILEISAKTGKGIARLLELLALQAEVLDLQAPIEGRAFGTVIESRIEKGRGAVATVLIEGGILNKGDIVVAGECSGKVRIVLDDRGNPLEDAGSSTPVEVLGLDGAPSGGEKFHVVENEKAAKQLVAHRREQRRRKESVQAGPSALEILKRKRDLCLKVVLRADVAGSAEAVRQSLEELSTEKVRVDVIFDGVGAINETDVKLASAGDAVIIGFNTKTVGKAAPAAESAKIPIYVFNVIYEAVDRVRELMIDLLPPEYREKDQGQAEVRQLFPIPRLGMVAGCRIIRGIVQRSSHIRVRRGERIVYTGKVGSLRVFKDDVKEVKEGFECGIVVENFPGLEAGDILESFELETLRPTL